MNRFSIRKNQGSSLLEVLISVLILSIGLLGLAALQVTSHKNNHSALFRTNAVVQAYNIIDRMRLNKSEDYTLVLGAAAPVGTLRKDTDLALWINELSTLLPAGAGGVSTTGNIVSVVVRWDDSRGTSDSSTPSFRSFSVSTQL